MQTVETRGGTRPGSIKFSERDGVHVLNGRLGAVDDLLSTGLNWNSLCVDLSVLGLGLSLQGIVLADAVDEGLSALGLADVLDADVDALRNDASVHALVHNYTDGVLGHVEDLAGLTMVELVRNTCLN